MRSVLLALVLITACATKPEAVSVAPVVAAERAFAAHAAAHGWIPAFRAFAAPDGIVFRADAANAAETFAALEDDGDRTLQWRPAFAGIARSGDFGFTTGPFFAGGTAEARGHYFTVWREQLDGQWKWIFDGGVGVRDASPIAADGEPDGLPVASSRTPMLRALAQIVEIETGIAAQAERDIAGAYGAFLAADARLNRPGAAPALGREAGLATAVAFASSARFEKLGGATSRAGDLVFSFGEARWTHEGAARQGHYCRMWQRRPEGWRIVFDQIIPRPPEPSPG